MKRFLLIATFVLYCTQAPAETLYVSAGHYSSIQQAIDNAENGDVIIVDPNTYPENINFLGKAITVCSTEPNDPDIVATTIIDGSSTAAPVVTFSGTEDCNCILTGFTITGGTHSGSGGAIAGNGTAATLSFCRITGNTANQGGGLYGCDGQIYNCFIANNHAETSGGGLYHCNASLINNTIAKNSAAITAGGLDSCLGTITNCIVWANTAPNSPGLNNCSEPTFSCLQSTAAGQANIYLDPQFVDTNNADYHLTIYSPCIDKGDNNSVPAQCSVDIDGEDRISIFDPNKTPIVDIGADEVVTNRADFDDDGTIDYRDFATMTEEWLVNSTALHSDLTSDEFVNFDDYTFFADDWAWQAPWHKVNRESALKFDSSSDGYVWIYTPEGCILNNVFTFTYTAWIYPLDFSQIQARIIGKNERAFMISYGGTLFGYSNGGGIAFSVSDVGSLQIGKWQFVMMIYDYYNGDKKVHLYIDGKEATYQVHTVGTESRPPLVDWRAEGEWNLMLGSQAWYPGTYIPNAIIDEVAIYDRVLTQEEIDYLYNNGLGRPTPPLLNPIGLWHFDEREGTTVIDSSGNNNDGLLQGTPAPAWIDGKFLSY